MLAFLFYHYAEPTSLEDKILHHIMFDIDGTLIQSYDLDSDCYIDAVKEVTGISINSDWANYEHVTDSGILDEIIRIHKLEDAHTIEKNVKQAFINKLKQAINKSAIKPVAGSPEFITHLQSIDNVIISLATGGWHESATLKLNSAGIVVSQLPIASANDHISRKEIMNIAVRRAKAENYKCTYFGDGIWDKKACEQLGFDFVLVGNKVNHTLQVNNYTSINHILNCIGP